MKRLIIIGASGHGKVVADVANKVGYNDILFLDNDSEKKECGGYPVVGTDASLINLDGDVFIAVGNPRVRQSMMEKYLDRTFPILIHPAAVVAESAKIDAGSIIMAGAIINPEAIIGKGCIVNTSSSVDHDCKVGDFVHIAIGAHVAGTVNIGSSTWIGAGATVSNNINICGGCMIGAGATVVSDITEPGTYIGVPARLKR